MAADAAARAGIRLAEPGAALLEQLDAVPCRRSWSRANPIDILGDAPAARYARRRCRRCWRTPRAAPCCSCHAPTVAERSDEIARACAPLVRAKRRPRVMGCWLGDAAVAPARQLFEAAGIPDYPTPEDAVRAFGMLQTYRRNQALLLEAPGASENPAPDCRRAAQPAAGQPRAADGREMARPNTRPRRCCRPTACRWCARGWSRRRPQACWTRPRELGYPVVLEDRVARYHATSPMSAASGWTCATRPR